VGDVLKAFGKTVAGQQAAGLPVWESQRKSHFQIFIKKLNY